MPAPGSIPLKTLTLGRRHHGDQQAWVAGALGFEPRLSVLETDVLPLTLCPYTLLHLFVRRVLPAELAELIALQPVRIVLLIFVGRIVPLLAERTRHVNDFTHRNS